MPIIILILICQALRAIESLRISRPVPITKTRKIREDAGNAFLVHGYDDVTMRDVKIEAQMSRAALYSDLGSKPEVFNVVIELLLSVIVES